MKTVSKGCLWLLFLAATVVSAQPRVGAKSGENTLTLEIQNTSGRTFQNLQARIATGGPAWVVPREGVVQNPAFASFNSMQKKRLYLSLPFTVTQVGSSNAQVNLELLDQGQVIGSFPVELDFSGTQARLANAGSSEAGLLAEPEQISLDIASEPVPTMFALKQNYPNPFNPTTTIQFDLPEGRTVSLRIYDLLGQEVRTLVNDERGVGFHHIAWDGRNQSGTDLPSGVYIYRLMAGSFISTQKMILLR